MISTNIAPYSEPYTRQDLPPREPLTSNHIAPVGTHRRWTGLGRGMSERICRVIVSAYGMVMWRHANPGSTGARYRDYTGMRPANDRADLRALRPRDRVPHGSDPTGPHYGR